MKKESTKKPNRQFKIIPQFSNNGNNIDIVIEIAFLKYHQYNDYK